MAQSLGQREFDKRGTAVARDLERPTSSQAPSIETEDDFVEFFNQSVDLLCIAGLDGYFKRLNPAWTTSLGWPIEELLGKPFVDFVHANDRERTIAEVAKLADGETAIFFENRYRHRDGSYRWLQWNARSHASQNRIYATARDITRRKRLEREVIDVVDRERERFGREIHDGLCQSLAGIAAFNAALSNKLLARGDPGSSARTDEVSELLKDTIRDARDMARGLDPISLDGGGIEGALETLAISAQRLFTVSCQSSCHREAASIQRPAQMQLLRIAQEALNNAIAHGHAGQVVIRLHCDANLGVLIISDNGVGLPDGTAHSTGMGLSTMAYRARLINGFLDVRRRQRRGTVVTCTFPLPA